MPATPPRSAKKVDSISFGAPSPAQQRAAREHHARHAPPPASAAAVHWPPPPPDRGGSPAPHTPTPAQARDALSVSSLEAALHRAQQQEQRLSPGSAPPHEREQPPPPAQQQWLGKLAQAGAGPASHAASSAAKWSQMITKGGAIEAVRVCLLCCAPHVLLYSCCSCAPRA